MPKSPSPARSGSAPVPFRFRVLVPIRALLLVRFPFSPPRRSRSEGTASGASRPEVTGAIQPRNCLQLRQTWDLGDLAGQSCNASTGARRLFRLRPILGALPLCTVAYHGVLPRNYQPGPPELDGNLVSRDEFRLQLRFLKSLAPMVEPEALGSARGLRDSLRRPGVLLTCDDGHVNNLTEMVPILQEEGVRCLFFITSDGLHRPSRMLWYERLYLALRLESRATLAMGLPPAKPRCEGTHGFLAAWREELTHLAAASAPTREEAICSVEARAYGSTRGSATLLSDGDSRRFGLMTRDHIQALISAGMSIGSHTKTHPRLSGLSDSEAWDEICGSASELAAAVGSSVKLLAFPFGGTSDVSARDVRFARASGYVGAFMNLPRSTALSPLSSRYVLPRVHMGTGLTQCRVAFEGTFLATVGRLATRCLYGYNH